MKSLRSLGVLVVLLFAMAFLDEVPVAAATMPALNTHSTICKIPATQVHAGQVSSATVLVDVDIGGSIASDSTAQADMNLLPASPSTTALGTAVIDGSSVMVVAPGRSRTA